MKREFSQSKIKFNKLKIGYYIRKSEKLLCINIQYLMDNTQCLSEREWEFPKGRRKLYETDLNCALREFEEETAINRNMITLDEQFKQFEELFIGKNKFRYRNVFYLASYNRDNLNESFYNSQNYDQIKEIGDVMWFDYDGACQKLVNKVEKLEIFRRIHYQIIKK
jgi:8-oxo-dGTP pyrophosphatase MutT (NUDIX family)